MTPSIESAKAALKDAKQNLRRAVYKQQLQCSHSYVLEAPYLPSKYGSDMPPMRVCASCGMVEDGWCCGYLILTGTFDPISRDGLYEMRQGLRITAEHKGPLLRKEVTVKELVTEWYNKEKGT